MGKSIRVVLADDHELVLDGLQRHLADTGDIAVLATANDGAELLAAVLAHRPDVVVTDLMMAGMDGFTAISRIRERGLTIPVLVLTAIVDGESLQRAVELEVDGIVLKTEPPRQTVEAIRQVAAGQVVYPRAVHNWLLRRARRREQGPQAGSPDRLSSREREVLTLIAGGKTNQEIAAVLQLSPNTVKFHLQNVFRKLQVNNRTEAARVYLEQRNVHL